MSRISVVGPDKARPAARSGTLAYLAGERDPLHLHLHRLAQGEALALEPGAVDAVAYVWTGALEAGGHRLEAGSSVIVERGRSVALAGLARQTQVLVFAAARPPREQREGGHVHILPVEQVPRSEDLGSGGVGGAMHADSGCPTCAVWLHENHFPAGPPLTPEEQQRGVHSHSEDEIIFVIDGEIRLGNRLCGPGTALAIAADTLYSFTAGPQGLSFVNFRAATPGDIQFANGAAISETAYWRERLPRPRYLEPGAASA